MDRMVDAVKSSIKRPAIPQKPGQEVTNPFATVKLSSLDISGPLNQLTPAMESPPKEKEKPKLPPKKPELSTAEKLDVDLYQKDLSLESEVFADWSQITEGSVTWDR
jgi:hypothetical protein